MWVISKIDSDDPIGDAVWGIESAEVDGIWLGVRDGNNGRWAPLGFTYARALKIATMLNEQSYELIEQLQQQENQDG